MPAVTRSILWLGFYGFILTIWVWLYFTSTGMGLDLIGRPNEFAFALARMDLCMDMSMTEFVPLLSMWIGMMAAMMLPTLVPTLDTYDNLIRSADGTRAGWIGLILGFFLVWAVVSVAFTSAQLALNAGGFIDVLGIATTRWFAAALLVGAGVYQFTHLKEACQTACMTPMQYFLGAWQTGFDGGVRMGANLGLYCVGCCWALMMLAFAGGMMNLAWMGLATALMVAEKLPQLGRYVTKPAGAALILGGFIVAAWPLTGG